MNTLHNVSKFRIQIIFVLLFVLALPMTVVNAQDTSEGESDPIEEVAYTEAEVVEVDVVMEEPTQVPTATSTPTLIPTSTPTTVPTEIPTLIPTSTATTEPSDTTASVPMVIPTSTPTSVPTSTPMTVVDETDYDSNAGSATVLSEETITLVLDVSYTEPTTWTNSVAGTLSVVGSNFTESTTVRLDGYGFLQTTYINDTAMTASLPTTIPSGKYTIEVDDPTNGDDTSLNTLRVYEEDVESTAVPGQPNLTVRNFSAYPASILPGDTTTLTFDVYNVGARTADGVVVTLNSTEFAPANGQSSVTLYDIDPYESYTVSLSVTSSTSLTEGIATIPITMTSYDETGATYSNSANLSVMILEEETGDSQIVLDSYLVTPGIAYPGDSVTVQALFKNNGTETAKQVLIQVSDGVLIAGSQGNSFSLGDMPAGSTVPVTMPLVVASDASEGTQAQSLSISYLQDDTVATTTASISVQIEEADVETPILLLDTYDSGQDQLAPGDKFVFNLTFRNGGEIDMSDMLLTFGSVEISTSTSTDTVTTSIIADSNFLPLGGGGTILLGDLAAGESVSTSQDFIVSGNLSNGVYTLGMTVQYTAENLDYEQSLNASLIVNTAPLLRITQENELDDPLTAGESYTSSLNIANLGSEDVMTTEVHVSGTNLTVTDSEVILLEALSSEDDTTENVTFEPIEAGTYTLMVEVVYIDDLNQTQTFTTEFTGNVEAEEQNSQRRPDIQPPTQTETTTDENLVGRVLLGFLGLGG